MLPPVSMIMKHGYTGTFEISDDQKARKPVVCSQEGSETNVEQSAQDLMCNSTMRGKVRTTSPPFCMVAL